MTTYPTDEALEALVAETCAPNRLDNALKTLLKTSRNAMATRTSPFAEPVPAGEKLVDDVSSTTRSG